MTNKWYRGVPTCQRSGGCISSCFPSRHVQNALPLLMREPSYVSWLVIPGLMCICASRCVFSHHLLAPQLRRPLWSQPPSSSSSSSLCFPLQCVPMKEGWDLSKPILSSVRPVNFFFFLGGLLRKFTHPWHHSGSKKKKKKKKIKTVRGWSVVFSDETIYGLSSRFSGFHITTPCSYWCESRHSHTEAVWGSYM